MILITGATGTNGVELIRRLSHSGAPVHNIRAMIRNPRDASHPALRGVPFAVADFDHLTTVQRALQGIDRAFLVTNSSERAERQQLDFVAAAAAAGVHHIVYLSQLHAAADSPVRFLRYHAVVENAIAASGMAFTHLRPNLYMQGLLGFRASIMSHHRFFAPAGDALVSLVDVRDIAAVAAAALTEQGHESKIYDLTGPQALTHAEIAGELSRALGQRIAYANLTDAQMRDALAGLGVPAWQADGLIEDYAHYRRNEAAAVSLDVRRVTGHAPHSFAEFARDYKGAFINAA